MSGRGTEVHILDRVVLAGDRVEPWLAEFRARYLPGARERGMTVSRLWRSHTGRDTVAVQILWSLPGVPSFYAMRGMTARDPRPAAFWSWTDDLAVTRERRVLEPLETWEATELSETSEKSETWERIV
ncbi:hypothetical protein ACIBKX_25820 [Streptomyces sp. NPDC050658]|uniref:hypothetical protein n=1 Tax=unclassified Streptomyces TaxID=2593676 RepID=UPI00342CFCE9